MRLHYLVFFALAAACADSADEASDNEADVAPAQPTDGKADGIDFTGMYRSAATHHYNNDVTSLELRAPVMQVGGTSQTLFVRSRCYHSSCALEVPQTNDYNLYTSTSGLTYVRFLTDQIWLDSSGNLQSQKQIDDVYEIKPTSTGIELRKAHTTRWFTLHRTVASSQCTASGGTWDAVVTACNCPGTVPGMFAAEIFVPGAGGCIATPGADESACDASTGMWTDDDATLIGSYCVCGYGRYDGPTGACIAI